MPPVRRSVPFENRKVCLRSFQQPFPRYRGQHNTHQEWIAILVGVGGDGDAFERLGPSTRRLEFMHSERLSAACSDDIRQGTDLHVRRRFTPTRMVFGNEIGDWLFLRIESDRRID